ncbi:DASH complex subunit Duo1-domain-containing protein [Glomus cerebriforme]|uniref:DASH complex subunit DUO1 n=1 Tax=Glomus cerebriforme TaxID=658196 RepID=A0A397TFA3_9GLOM|nr:DASH complex subunit Duo1-domain-containing protein [Glomus cerebriforme]
MSSPIGVSTPTINDQEFPDNSLLNDNDSLIWFTDHENTPRAKNIYNEFDSLISENNNYYHPHLDDFDFTKDDDVSPISIDTVISPDYTNHSLENFLPDYLTNDNRKEENSLKKEYDTLLKMNEMFEKINNNMNQARINLQQFSTTVEQTDQLLDLWIGILSQSIHTQQILCDPSWLGDSIEKMRILEEQAQQPPK